MANDVGRQTVTQRLFQLSQDRLETVKDRELYNTLATHNQNGTLTPNQSKEVLEMFGDDGAVMIDNGNERYVTISQG